MENPVSLTTIYFRFFGLLLALPVGYTLIGYSIRIVLAGLFAACFSVNIATFSFGSLISVPTEIILGFLLGMPIVLAVQMGLFFGELFDLGRGQSIAQIYDPVTNSTPSTSSVFIQYAVLTILFNGGLILSSVGVLWESLSMIPSGTIILDQSKIIFFTKLIAQSVLTTLLFFTPFGLLFVSIEYMIGCLGSVAPRLSLNSESFKLKSLFGIMGIILIINSGILSSFQLALRSTIEQCLHALSS